MPCNEWNEQWVAKLYDELDPEEDRLLTRHLERCEECRHALDELGQSRELLQASSPYVPASPKVVVLRPSGLRQPLWAFASGLAAALLVFAVGLGVGYKALSAAPSDEVPQLQARIVSDAEARLALEARIDALEVQLVQQASATPVETTPPEALQAMVSRDQFEDGLRRLEERVNYDRVRDMEFLMGEMTAVEWRAGKWVDETREAVQLAFMQSDPRFNER
jgi:anti-sigma factor RsiW